MNPLQKKISESVAFILGIGIGLILTRLSQNNDLSATKQYGVTLTEKGYFLVSVLAANKFLDTRAKAIYETWAKNNKNVLFFSQSKKVDTELPVIFLPGTDDSYPPQRKSFTMLKYLYENFIDSYEWFIRADDDVYIKLDKLKFFLNQFDPRKALYIGQPGIEHSPDKPFCMGGPGIILSKEALKRVGPHLNSCYQNLIQTEHEDVEIGRCIKKYANISCTFSYEVIFFCFYFELLFLF